MPASIAYIIHLRFIQALTIVRSIPEQEVGLQPIPTDRLKFYGFYRQATFGECNTPKPSSRNVVEYAKWKAWYRVRHHSCLEAKKLYVNLLVELLVEFINRYPNNPHHEFAKQALHSLESNISAGSDCTNYTRESTFFIQDERITSMQPLPQDTVTSSNFTSSSWISKSPSLQAPTTPSSATTYNNDDPWMPTLSPQNHTKQSTIPSNRMMSMVMNLTTIPASMDAHRLCYTTSEQSRTLSPTTTTATTSSPPTSSTPSRKKKKAKINRHHQCQQNDRQLLLPLPERTTLEKLHMEITTLAEQMNQLGQEARLSHDVPRIKRHHSTMIKLGWRFLVKTLIRHLLVNALMTGFVFWILWHQQSPTAHAMVDFLTPHIKALVHSSIKKTVFWKLKM